MIYKEQTPSIVGDDVRGTTGRLPRIVACGVIVMIVAAMVCPDVRSENTLKCGSETRIVTHSGTVIQGKLRHNSPSWLHLECGRAERKEIALSDVAKAYRVRRYTGVGILAGTVVGTGIGIVVAKEWERNRRPYPLDRLNQTIAKFTAIVLGGAIVGGIFGGLIGHEIYSIYEVQLEASPMCMSPSGNVEPLGLTLSLSF